MKKVWALLMIAAVITLGATMGTLAEESSVNLTKDGKLKVAYINPTRADAYQNFLEMSIEKYFETQENENIIWESFDAQGDWSNLTSIIEQITADGEFGMMALVAPTDVSDYLQTAMDSGTAVILVNFVVQELLDSGKFSCVLCDDVSCGRVITDFVASQLPEGGKGFILQGTAGQLNVQYRDQGIDEGLEAAGNLEVIARKNADWLNDTAYTVVTDWLTSTGGDFDFIISHNDNMALGAVEALKTAELNPSDYIIIGIDGLYNGCVAVKNGDLSGTALQDTNPYSEYLYQCACDLFDGSRAVTDVANLEFSPIILGPEDVDQYIEIFEELGLDK